MTTSASLLDTPDLSTDDKRRIARQCTKKKDYSVCRNRVTIRANTRLPIDSYDRMYGGFGSIPAPADAPHIEVFCLEEKFGPTRTFTLFAGDRTCRLSRPDTFDRLFVVLAYLVAMNIRSHYLVHASCVSRAGRAIVMPAASGIGKSTLSSYLVNRGMGFLSDEVAPIHRATGTVDPFPRRVGIRPGPAEDLVEGLPSEILDSATDRKRLLDPALLGAPPVVDPLPIHAVVFLTQQLTDKVATAQRFDGTVRICVQGASDAFRDDLLHRTGATLIRETILEPQCVSFELDVEHPGGFLKAIYATVDAHGAALVGLAYEDTALPDFTREPTLLPVPPSTGVMELVKKIGMFQKKAIIEREFDGKLSRLVAELTSLVSGVSFYKLSPGRLDRMIDLVEGLP
ncbi:MAG: hypothetical protein HQ559_03995 [Lentisphaerae bacterium]|nr:hypothetical protein [Lentisphaerota bacterium]